MSRSAGERWRGDVVSAVLGTYGNPCCIACGALSRSSRYCSTALGLLQQEVGIACTSVGYALCRAVACK